MKPRIPVAQRQFALLPLLFYFLLVFAGLSHCPSSLRPIIRSQALHGPEELLPVTLLQPTNIRPEQWFRAANKFAALFLRESR